MGTKLRTVQAADLSQNQILSARILAMDCTELSEYLTELMKENPVLDMDKMLESTAAGQLSWSGVRCRRRGGDEDTDVLDTVGRSDIDLRRSLHLQLNDRLYGEQELGALNYMIECVDSDGFMTESLDFIEDRFWLSPGRAHELLEVIQAMSPCGVGARDVRECILIQLRCEHPKAKLAIKIAEGYLTELADNRLSYIAKKLSTDISEVVGAAQLIKSLSPRPGACEDTEVTCSIIPDVSVLWKDGRYQVEINSGGIPQVAVSPEYRRLAADTDDDSIREYIREKYRQANWVANCMAQRDTTLRRISEQILSEQRSFFHLGPQALCALTQKQIAEALDVHESTVSRALRNKYLQCRWGVFPMKYFFSENMQSDSSAVSSVHALISTLVEKEDKKNPLTDKEIAERISGLGTAVSRRTVAKYREELGYAPSAKRKAF
jgi:RNA polymerase sigma-54 factor